MRKIFFLFICFCSGFLFSQGRFIYELKFKIDSTKRENVQSEVFNLDISKGTSYFYSRKYAEFDSISVANKKLGIKTKRPDPKLDYQIIKNYKDNTMFFREMVGADIFEVKDLSTQKWKLHSDKKTIANMPVQLATCSYKGRKWLAWFTKDIPIADGPYKFKGLPGLILEVYDSRDDYHFSLIQIDKTFNTFNNTYLQSLGLKVVKSDLKSYLNRKQVVDDNPALTLTQMPGIDKVVLEKSVIDDFVNAYRTKQKLRNNSIELKQ